MTDIKFTNHYGYKPSAPFWLVWNEAGRRPTFKHPTPEAAEAEAARLASENPGTSFHVLGVLATIETSTDIVGTRFDPTRAPLEAIEPAPPPPPAPALAPLENVDPATFLMEDADAQPF